MGKMYLLECNGLYKIGVTTRSMKNRIKDLQTGNPYIISLVFHKACINYIDMEKYFHNKFADKRLVGEWFALDKKDIEYVMNCRLYSIFKSKRKEIEE